MDIIANRGYPVETHTVTTADGYILEVHRIPYGKGQSSNTNSKRRVVFLQHGFLNTDNVWLIQPSDRALGKNETIQILLIFQLIQINGSTLNAVQLTLWLTGVTMYGLATLAALPIHASMCP